MKTSLYLLSAAAFAAVAGITLGGPPARAQEYPWCAVTSLNYGTPDCSYVTIDQCRAGIVGGGGYCQQNPRATPPQGQMPRRGYR